MRWHGKNLMQILDETDETHHLNELMILRSKEKKGASADELLNEIIHPTLEDLEFYLKYYLDSETETESLKIIISSWIEAQKKK
ncbi:MAG: hypothetical protein PHP13_05485 [Methanomicrobium sp.]|nr:hypothetical protein [Methanomicrobium sp.]MDD4300141.1 hypothetical protein [Methanomicrobium sp.]